MTDENDEAGLDITKPGLIKPDGTVLTGEALRRDKLGKRVMDSGEELRRDMERIAREMRWKTGKGRR